ncbi:NAD(P)-binding protein [Podospora didyma]|uniref:NAD(P)-binding protein n=1 Tax=Podospora didyma TaxID=330526 RepID=A0AAE0K1J1_9PEZI|nr:NAD(P)-binding protein [Podospora didyma]
MTTEKRLIVVVGATGNQGGSVARRFLKDPRFTVRGLTRNTSSPAAQELAALGAEMVAIDLDDVETLKPAFKGANVIFSVTQYWEPFFRPDHRALAKEQGITCRKFAYDTELRHGKNIADAAATTVDSLDPNGFLASTTSSARRCSNGRFQDLYHYDAKADIFPYYVAESLPALHAKASYIQTGFFMTSHQILPNSYFNKQPDGSFEMRFCMPATKTTPQLDVNRDTGNFVYAVYQRPPGGEYMAAGSQISWGDYIALWSKVTGVKAVYKEVTYDEQVAAEDDYDKGVEIALMFDYSGNPGYDGGVDLLTFEDLRKDGIDCPMTSLEEFFRAQDWSAIINKPVDTR